MAAALVLAAALFLAAALQPTLFAHLHLTIRGVPPNLVVLLITSIGLTRGVAAGTAAGLFGGLLCASLYGERFAGILVGHMAVGYLAGKLRGRVFADRPLVVVLAAVVAVGLSETVILVFHPPGHFLSWLASTAIAVAYSGLLAPVTHGFVRVVQLRFPPPLAD